MITGHCDRLFSSLKRRMIEFFCPNAEWPLKENSQHKFQWVRVFWHNFLIGMKSSDAPIFIFLMAVKWMLCASTTCTLANCGVMHWEANLRVALRGNYAISRWVDSILCRVIRGLWRMGSKVIAIRGVIKWWKRRNKVQRVEARILRNTLWSYYTGIKVKISEFNIMMGCDM